MEALWIVLLLAAVVAADETRCSATDCKLKYGDSCQCCASYITTEEQCDICRLEHNCSECAQIDTCKKTYGDKCICMLRCPETRCPYLLKLYIHRLHRVVWIHRSLCLAMLLKYL